MHTRTRALTLDCILVFSAIRFSSGVSATLVALAFGTCLQELKKNSLGGRVWQFQQKDYFRSLETRNLENASWSKESIRQSINMLP